MADSKETSSAMREQTELRIVQDWHAAMQPVRSLRLAHLASNDVRVIKGRHENLLFLQSPLLQGSDSIKLADQFLSLTECQSQSA